MEITIIDRSEHNRFSRNKNRFSFSGLALVDGEKWVNPLTDEAQTALFKSPVRTAL